MAQQDSDWQQPPSISGGLPFTLQMLSTGAGVGIGCGVGVGFISPINLSAVPVLGQAAQGISAGLGGVSTWLGTAGQSARQAARGLGVPGLDVGAGCGVLAGYYFGAGLMIKPSVVDQVARATTALAGQLTQAISQKLGQPAAGTASPVAAAASLGCHDSSSQQQPSLFSTAVPAPAANSSSSSSNLSGMLPGGSRLLPSTEGMIPGQQQVQGSSGQPAQQQQQAQPSPATAPQDPVTMRLLLQQQADIAVLRRQNKQLRAAVCRIDPEDPVCRSSRGRREKGAKRKKGVGPELGDDFLSDSTWND